MEEVKEEDKQELSKLSPSALEEFFKKKLEAWKDVEVDIAVTGDAGVGKSSFINAIRGLHEDDEGAAAVDVKDCTEEPTPYHHPKNDKITLWDLPGIGTTENPDLESYCEREKFEKKHTFLILTATRFTNVDNDLAKKISSIDKKFFFVRTKIDQDITNETRKKSFNENATLEKIRGDCSKKLLEKQDIFLISNHYPEKWDFDRLTQAILDALPRLQKESLTLSLTRLSTAILKRKVDVLKERLWMVASVSAVAAVFPFPGVAIAVDIALILHETRFYRSQLELPDEGSEEFLRLHVLTQKQIAKHCLTTATQIGTLLAPYATETAIEEAVRFIPVIGVAIASGLSFGATYVALKHYLESLEQTALLVMTERTGQEWSKKMV